MKNNKGFVITGILYAMLLLFSIIVFGLISIAAIRKMNLNKIGDDVKNNMTSSKGEYRYFSGGNYSEWLSYDSLDKIRYEYSVSYITNSGINNKMFNLQGKNTNLLINGNSAGLKFNGNSYAINEGALKFDGTNTYVEFNQSMPDVLTIEMWAYANVIDRKMLFSFNNASYTNGPDLFFYGSKIALNSNGDTVSNVYGTAIYPTINTWHHYAVTFDKTNNISTLYIDGVNVGTAEYRDPSGNKLYIGRYSNNNDWNWNGIIKNVRVWNTIRTESDIKDNMSQSLIGNEQGLILYNPLNINNNNKIPSIVGSDGEIVSGTVDESINTNTLNYKSIYLDFTSNTCNSVIASFNKTNTVIGLDNNCNLYLKSGTNITTTTYKYTIGSRASALFLWDNAKYNFVVNGTKYTGTTTTTHVPLITFTHLALGFAEATNDQYFSGTIYALVFNESAISDANATNLTNTKNIASFLPNSSIVYDFTKYIHLR